MYVYHFMQWICFFYIYCFLGWIWESSYVSITNHKWTNRGFLYEPLLPIYGCGAICILFVTLPFRQQPYLIFFFGAVTASILEYITGAAMEALFKIRYWDYSNEKWNLNGYICLKCSITWGIFSVLLIKLLHNPIETFVLSIDDSFLIAVFCPLTAITAIDIALSFKNAFELRNLLEHLTNINENITEMQQRLDTIFISIKEDKKEWEKKIDKKREYLEERMMNLQQDITEHLLMWKNNKAVLEIPHIETSQDLKNELSHMLKQVEENRAYIKAHKEKKKNFRSIIKRNPTAVSIKYRKVFEEVKESIKNSYSKK